jgi:DNA-binding CsgD family transcriptional regulator
MTETDLLEISSAFYEGVLSPGGWQKGLMKLAAATSSDAASIVLWNRTQDLAMVGEQVGLPDELQNEYRDHFHLLDPGREFVDGLREGQWYLDERDLSPSRIRRSPFYRDFLCRYELNSSMATRVLRSPGGTDGFLSLSGRPGRRDMGKVMSKLATLLPHIRRAAMLRIKLIDMAQQLDISKRALDRFGFPLIAIGADRKVILANRLGEAWLSTASNPLSLASMASGKVGCLLRLACGVEGRAQAGWIRLEKPLGGFYSLNFIPLPADTGSAGNAWATAMPSALVWVNDPAYRNPPSAEFLQQIFHLSAAEIALTRAMLRGDTLQEWADSQQLSINTVRTQLKSVFLKVGVRRQSELHSVLGSTTIVGADS